MEAIARRGAKSQRSERLARFALVAVGLVFASEQVSSAFGFASGGAPSRLSRGSVARQAAASSKLQALQGTSTLTLIQAQSSAGHKMKDIGKKLQKEEFEASALDGKAKVKFDGFQNLRSVEIADDALSTAGGSEALAKALLGALQEGHDSSAKGTEADVWNLYQDNSELLQAPLNQIGAGNTVEDLWANVTKTDESVKLAEELFLHFDKDQDGYWNLNETKEVQLATEGTEMAEEAFNSLIIAAAPDGGRRLTEEEMQKGLSKEQLIDLYTNAQRQRQLGFVLDIFKDHHTVFSKEAEAAEENAAGAAPAPPPALD
eukprot:gb/GFBE01061121.1/.p1 GENE.gb/GFBE01061121.1/~~gb/GFBE01061121.1/.p1  ORF type:complete len:317 (+),score=91.92 gb/GFBE01061121.1/:1-951(+)